MPDAATLDLSAMRRVYEISARISARRSLVDTLQAVVNGVVEGLGFGIAVVNYRHPDQTFETVAVAGSQEAREMLLGRRAAADTFDEEFAVAEEWGLLRFVPHERLPEPSQAVGWIPNVPVLDVADAWHPLDALFAPLHSADGELVGVLSVDLPRDGVRPGPVQRELLELFALQAGIAIDAARLTEKLRRDEQALREEQARLAASEAVLRVAFEGSNGGLAIIGLEDGGLGRVLRVNDALCSILRRTPAEMLDGSVADLIVPEEAASSARALAQAAAGEVGVYRAERRFLRGDGEVVWLSFIATAVDSGEPGVRWLIVHADDVTARKDAERRLERQATHDPLTGLPNRRLLRQRLQAALRRDRDGRRPGAVLFCDLDGFKHVNDRHGHAAGDQALRTVATRLLAQVRSRDTVARLGGDEFVVVAEDIGPDAVEALRARIVDAVRQPLPGVHARVTVSVGIAMLDLTGLDVDAVLHEADLAMYASRRVAPPA